MNKHLSDDDVNEWLERPFLELGKAFLFVLAVWVFLFLLFSIG